MSTQPTTGGNDHPHDEPHATHAAQAAVNEADELEGLKLVMLDSAELATRSATLAVDAGEKIQTATHNLEGLMKSNKKQHQIMLGVAGGVAAALACETKAEVATLDGRKIREILSRRDAGPFTDA